MMTIKNLSVQDHFPEGPGGHDISKTKGSYYVFKVNVHY
jgi:hypothetical protein